MLKFLLKMCGLTSDISNKIKPKNVPLITEQPHFKSRKVAWVLGP